MNFIIRETQPLKMKINGVEYPAIWNFKAISLMEDFTGIMHLFTLSRFREGRFEPKELIGALVGVLKAAGVECPDQTGKDALAEALMASIRPDEEKSICEQLMTVISAQGDQPAEGDQKNAGTRRKKTSKTSGTTD